MPYDMPFGNRGRSWDGDTDLGVIRKELIISAMRSDP